MIELNIFWSRKVWVIRQEFYKLSDLGNIMNYRNTETIGVYWPASEVRPLSVTGVSHKLRTSSLWRCSEIFCRPMSPNC